MILKNFKFAAHSWMSWTSIKCNREISFKTPSVDAVLIVSCTLINAWKKNILWKEFSLILNLHACIHLRCRINFYFWFDCVLSNIPLMNLLAKLMKCCENMQIFIEMDENPRIFHWNAKLVVNEKRFQIIKKSLQKIMLTCKYKWLNISAPSLYLYK